MTPRVKAILCNIETTEAHLRDRASDFSVYELDTVAQALRNAADTLEGEANWRTTFGRSTERRA